MTQRTFRVSPLGRVILYVLVAFLCLSTTFSAVAAFIGQSQRSQLLQQVTLVRQAVCPKLTSPDPTGERCLKELRGAQAQQAAVIAKIASATRQIANLRNLCRIMEALDIPERERSCDPKLLQAE